MTVLIIIAWAAVILTLFTAASAALIKVRRPTIAHDGHYIRRENDITCETQYGHYHPGPEEFRPDEDMPAVPGEPTPRYIVHDDPEEGYVVLNGIKRKLEDCKYF